MHSFVKCLFVNTRTEIVFIDTEKNELAGILDKVCFSFYQPLCGKINYQLADGG